MTTRAFMSIGVIVPVIVFLVVGNSYIMIWSPSISFLALHLLKLRDKDPLREILSIDLAGVFPSSSAIGLTQNKVNSELRCTKKNKGVRKLHTLQHGLIDLFDPQVGEYNYLYLLFL